MSFSIIAGEAASASDILAAIGIALLVLLLFFRELSGALGQRTRAVARAFMVAIIPLLITFALLVAARGVQGI